MAVIGFSYGMINRDEEFVIGGYTPGNPLMR
jgi:hypothetical protein